MKILGKGGCGVVFLCKNLKTDKEYALKQICKRNKSESTLLDLKKEVEINFELTSEKQNYLLKLIDFIEDSYDMWLVFDKGGNSLGNLLFKIKGEFYNNERIYFIKKGRFYQHLFYDKEINFKNFLRKILETINYMSSKHEIVHCDIKPDNILFKYNSDLPLSSEIDFTEMKFIDLGSAFRICDPNNFSSNTPEYMPPEITELIEKKYSSKEIYNFLKNFDKYPYAIDIWSLGVMILEILISCPVWMSYKARTIIKGKVRFFYSRLFLQQDYSESKVEVEQRYILNNMNWEKNSKV